MEDIRRWLRIVEDVEQTFRFFTFLLVFTLVMWKAFATWPTTAMTTKRFIAATIVLNLNTAFLWRSCYEPMRWFWIPHCPWRGSCGRSRNKIKSSIITSSWLWSAAVPNPNSIDFWGATFPPQRPEKFAWNYCRLAAAHRTAGSFTCTTPPNKFFQKKSCCGFSFFRTITHGHTVCNVHSPQSTRLWSPCSQPPARPIKLWKKMWDFFYWF